MLLFNLSLDLNFKLCRNTFPEFTFNFRKTLPSRICTYAEIMHLHPWEFVQTIFSGNCFNSTKESITYFTPPSSSPHSNYCKHRKNRSRIVGKILKLLCHFYFLCFGQIDHAYTLLFFLSMKHIILCSTAYPFFL